MRNENIGGEHHGKIPIVDPTGGTAPILHEPCLERTEEQNADHIAYAIGKADQN